MGLMIEYLNKYPNSIEISYSNFKGNSHYEAFILVHGIFSK
jgi:hypothetical protein